VSGYAENTLLREGTVNAGVLLSKPFRKRDLALVVRQALDGDAIQDQKMPQAA